MTRYDLYDFSRIDFSISVHREEIRGGVSDAQTVANARELNSRKSFARITRLLHYFTYVFLAVIVAYMAGYLRIIDYLSLKNIGHVRT